MTAEEKLDKLENKYREFVKKAKEMMESSQTPGAYLGYKAQGELVAVFLFEINELRQKPKPLEDVLP
jgi:parvulin-like peptidyl-prolyl isomerase